ncbi:hypothetical protein K1T73_15900 [Roseovarius sp. SCSIO 43702]|uniref:hypothetical protein n=1 Tax=Roseovarius sp. SCSIO 43702 TaxID=2823043 RepID=UPI001C72EB3D|nr:hypothetical protein [Roseovarius sp. SCSIO 43702]QYX56508.1 hypothetical protein K1T73_15900 [Roseovarius sp. SCSIO 43702]
MIQKTRICPWPHIFATLFLFLSLSAPAQAWFFGKDHPGEARIEEIVRADLPEHMAIEEIEIGSQDTREGLVEFSESRVRVTLAPREALFTTAGTLEDRTTLLTRIGEPGTGVSLFALVRARATGEGWDGQIFWDDDEAISDLGWPRSRFGADAIVQGTPEHEEHLAMLQKRREDAERARLALQRSVSGSFEGTVSCGYRHYEIAKLVTDAVEGTGTLTYRKVAAAPTEWSSKKMTVEQVGTTPTFRVSGGDWDFSVAPAEDGATFSNPYCSMDIYPLGDTPDAVATQRAVRAEWLGRLSAGSIPARAAIGDKELDVTVTITERREHGFQMHIDHPMHLNGRFNLSGWRSQSTVDIRFADAPVPLHRAGTVEGRGDPMLVNRCGLVATFKQDGTLRLQEGEGYTCGAWLDLTP